MEKEEVKITDYEFLKRIYNKSIKARAKIDRLKFNDTNIYQDVVEKLRDEGSSVHTETFTPESANILKKVNLFLESGENIIPSRDLRSLDTRSLKGHKRISEELIKKGVNSYRDITDSIQIRDPFLTIPETFEIATDDRILSVVQDYYGVMPSISFVKIVRNFANKVPRFNSQFYHIDSSSSSILKVLIYLNDINDDYSGHHCYVASSHHEHVKRSLWNVASTYGDFSSNSVVERFGEDSIMKIKGNKGTAIFEDTTGLHRGEKPTVNDRNILIINYCIHEEYTHNYKKDKKSKISRVQYESIDDKKIRVLDLLDIG